MTLSMIPDMQWLNPPPLMDTPVLRMEDLTLAGTSIHPSLIPGPNILENVQLDTTFP